MTLTTLTHMLRSGDPGKVPQFPYKLTNRSHWYRSTSSSIHYSILVCGHTINTRGHSPPDVLQDKFVLSSPADIPVLFQLLEYFYGLTTLRPLRALTEVVLI